MQGVKINLQNKSQIIKKDLAFIHMFYYENIYNPGRIIENMSSLLEG